MADSKTSKGTEIGFYDASDKLYNSGHTIEFTHISSGKTVKFKAWLTNFSDDYQSNWNSEEIYGRMDPIQTFQSTRRTISLAWDVVAASEAEAIINMEDATALFQMLYPQYSGQTLKSPPLLRLKFLNLIQDVSSNLGLVGTVAGFSFTPDIDEGFFDNGKNPGVVYPQALKMECTFTCLHTHDMGYGKQSKFPYNVKAQGTTAASKSDNTTTNRADRLSQTEKVVASRGAKKLEGS